MARIDKGRGPARNLVTAQWHLNQARASLEFVKLRPDFSCDVCGPYDHAFHMCQQATINAIKSLLVLHGYEPEQTYDLIRLAEPAARHVDSFEQCMHWLRALVRCGELDWRVPSNIEAILRERREAIRLTEQIVEFVTSHVPADAQGVISARA